MAITVATSVYSAPFSRHTQVAKAATPSDIAKRVSRALGRHGPILNRPQAGQGRTIEAAGHSNRDAPQGCRKHHTIKGVAEAISKG